VCHVGIRHNLKGTNACITNQCIGGLTAVAESANALREGEADRAVAVGHDAPIDAETLANFDRVELLARETLRPFDAERDGTVMGEGAAGLVLEKVEEAQTRGARVWGEFLGAGSTTEAAGILDVQSDGEGVVRAIQLALADAGVKPGGIGMIVAHANGTPGSDASEAKALQTVFGDQIPPITGFKWAIGHTFAACGAMDLVLALLALRDGCVPGIATLRTLDPELAPLPVSPAAQIPTAPTALVICRGFGGMNVAAIVGAPPAHSGT